MKKFLVILKKGWIYIIGFVALIWFVIRVVPKPSRAAYPCQRAAFPIASAFVLWLTGTLFSFRFFRNARSLMRKNRALGALGLFVAGVSLLALSNLAFPAKKLVAGVKEATAKAVAPEMMRVYSPGLDQTVEPAACVSLVKAGTEDVFDIGYEEVEQMVREAVALAGGLAEIVSDGNTVVLKPNIVVNNFMGNPISAEANGMVTDWRVVSVVAKMVREVNPTGEILVIEGSSSESTTEGYTLLNYTKEYIPEVDEFLGIEESSGDWHDYDSDQLSSFLVPSGKALYEDYKLPTGAAPYYYNKRYFEADVIISLPVLKNHETAGVTGAVKNMGIGGTPTNIYGNSEDANGRWEVISHSAPELQKFIHDYYFGCPAQFAVMDGIQGYDNGPNWNNGPTNIEGHQKGMGLILASKDPLAMDAIASLLMFHDPVKVPHLVYLNNNSLGCSDPMAIRVVGELVSDFKKPFEHENHKTSCSYTDDVPPSASIDSLVIEDNVLKIALLGNSDLRRIDVQVDGQEVEQFFIRDFGNIEVDLESFELTDSMVNIFAHDLYMNTRQISMKATGPGNGMTGQTERFFAAEPSVYPNPVGLRMMVRLTLQYPGEVLCSLHSLSGKILAEQKESLSAGYGEMEFDLSGTAPGVYILVVVSGGERYTLPIVKL